MSKVKEGGLADFDVCCDTAGALGPKSIDRSIVGMLEQMQCAVSHCRDSVVSYLNCCTLNDRCDCHVAEYPRIAAVLLLVGCTTNLRYRRAQKEASPALFPIPIPSIGRLQLVPLVR